jgi:hypothetical protein
VFTPSNRRAHGARSRCNRDSCASSTAPAAPLLVSALATGRGSSRVGACFDEMQLYRAAGLSNAIDPARGDAHARDLSWERRVSGGERARRPARGPRAAGRGPLEASRTCTRSRACRCAAAGSRARSWSAWRRREIDDEASCGSLRGKKVLRRNR